MSFNLGSIVCAPAVAYATIFPSTGGFNFGQQVSLVADNTINSGYTDGSSPSIIHNINNLTANAGVFTVTFATGLPTANYNVVGSYVGISSGGTNIYYFPLVLTNPTTSGFTLHRPKRKMRQNYSYGLYIL